MTDYIAYIFGKGYSPRPIRIDRSFDNICRLLGSTYTIDWETIRLDQLDYFRETEPEDSLYNDSFYSKTLCNLFFEYDEEHDNVRPRALFIPTKGIPEDISHPFAVVYDSDCSGFWLSEIEEKVEIFKAVVEAHYKDE